MMSTARLWTEACALPVGDDHSPAPQTLSDVIAEIARMKQRIAALDQRTRYIEERYRIAQRAAGEQEHGVEKQ